PALSFGQEGLVTGETVRLDGSGDAVAGRQDIRHVHLEFPGLRSFGPRLRLQEGHTPQPRLLGCTVAGHARMAQEPGSRVGSQAAGAVLLPAQRPLARVRGRERPGAIRALPRDEIA